MTKPREKPEVTEFVYRGQVIKLKYWGSVDQWETDVVYYRSGSKAGAINAARDQIDTDLLSKLTEYYSDESYNSILTVNGCTLYHCPICHALTNEVLDHYDWHHNAKEEK